MQIIRWTDGGFGMAAHNYDGDMLTDEVAQVHRSPGFITSNLIGKTAAGTLIKEFEASHGTVADMWAAHLRGEETSLNPLGMVEALTGAMNHSATLSGNAAEVQEFTARLRKIIHGTMVSGKGTRDLCGPEGLTTEQFVDCVAEQLNGVPAQVKGTFEPIEDTADIDTEALKQLFNELDADGNGSIDFEELKRGLRRLNVLPRKLLSNLGPQPKED